MNVLVYIEQKRDSKAYFTTMEDVLKSDSFLHCPLNDQTLFGKQNALADEADSPLSILRGPLIRKI